MSDCPYCGSSNTTEHATQSDDPEAVLIHCEDCNESWSEYA